MAPWFHLHSPVVTNIVSELYFSLFQHFELTNIYCYTYSIIGCSSLVWFQKVNSFSCRNAIGYYAKSLLGRKMSRFESRTTIYFSLLVFSTLTVSTTQSDIRKFFHLDIFSILEIRLYRVSLRPLHVGCKVFSEFKLKV